MAEITEDYVSFETAKLLREKGFDIPCMGRYSVRSREFHLDCTKMYNNGGFFVYAAPTLQMAMKWLREVHGIYLGIQPDFPSDKDYKMCWCWSANILHENCISTKGHQCYIETYEEAVESAIKYCLENLV